MIVFFLIYNWCAYFFTYTHTITIDHKWFDRRLYRSSSSLFIHIQLKIKTIEDDDTCASDDNEGASTDIIQRTRLNTNELEMSIVEHSGNEI